MKIKHIKCIISLAVLGVITLIVHTGQFMRDCFVTAFVYVIALGIINILYKIIAERIDKK